MRCPTCDQSLRACHYEGAPLHTCDSCHGEFVGAGALRDIVNARQTQFSDELLASVRDRAPVFGLPDVEGEGLVGCPSCDMAMIRLNCAGDTGVVVDRCPSCGGVWLDADELECVQAILERYQDRAPQQLHALRAQLQAACENGRESAMTDLPFSRFDVISAVVNQALNRAA